MLAGALAALGALVETVVLVVAEGLAELDAGGGDACFDPHAATPRQAMRPMATNRIALDMAPLLPS
ncbi:hypothetical protein OQ968_15065 [Mycobacterium sp. 663a-19]|uniref:hypothetical protein n=1 Tax=Mycobacterium sp. 663a-19 TaxID=2986148 RepID=UPI002D1E686D|nr:hypothetical protein [Mycobacterium sp. 663a-19]MEB3982583.1 hypothetical protein [Mycobacterium sp. 663a-19]